MAAMASLTPLAQLLLLLLLLLASAAAAAAASPEDAVFTPGKPVYDTRGKRIYAGGANIFAENGTFYVVGEGEKVYSDCSECIQLYKSADLATWHYVGCILNNSDVVAPQPGTPHYRMERPKIFRCPGSQKMTMWFHCDTPGFSMRSVGVLTAPSVEGPYSFVKPCFRPDGRDSYDMGTFVDDRGDGKAYLIRSVENSFAGISAMNDDCSDVTGIVSSGPDMEGQALMRDGGKGGALYAMGSHLTGWAPNAMQFVATTSATLPGAVWVNNSNPTGDSTSFGGQSTFIYPYVHPDGHTTFIAMLDRWNMGPNPLPGGLENMTWLWLPMTPPSPAPPAPSPPAAGWLLTLAACDAGSTLQQFELGADSVVHAGSGLCVRASGDSNNDLALASCDSSDSSQAWAAAGQIVANKKLSFNFNNANNDVSVGNPVIAYAPTGGWNERWDIRASSSAPGAFEALDSGGRKSGNCIAATDPNAPSSSWTIKWHDSWRLGDF